MGDEIHIALYLSSPQMRSDPRNRTVVILDVIPIHGDSEQVILVMPYLRQFHSPPFHCRAEFVEAMRQFIQVGRHGSNYRLTCILNFIYRASSSCTSKISHMGKLVFSLQQQYMLILDVQ
jgi:hypothetical protein